MALLYTQTGATLYTLRVTAAVSSGVGTAGIAFFNANGTRFSFAPAVDLQSRNATTLTFRISAPHGVVAASVYVGKFDGEGHIEVRLCCYVTEACCI